ncbi:MAG TPA: ATP phosphoribosyltransferase [Candidatus Paceibacterota bacterium]|jgi:ATP phosphoribosyltransferase|nr:ATP phosphoribosyltransferase [Candidatus Paceibacterota bacterium]
MKNDRLKIAIQKKGRLSEASLAFLNSLGLRFRPNGHSLIQKCENKDIDLILLRDDDIPEYVSRGIADFAIIGQNVLLEKQLSAETVRELDFAKCSVSIAVPENSTIKTPKDLEGERIATTYPQLLKGYLVRNNINCAIIPILGSVEITPELNLADAICDVVQTGNTLKAHNLKPLVTILESKALLITNNVTKNGKQELKELLLK